MSTVNPSVGRTNLGDHRDDCCDEEQDGNGQQDPDQDPNRMVELAERPLVPPPSVPAAAATDKIIPTKPVRPEALLLRLVARSALVLQEGSGPRREAQRQSRREPPSRPSRCGRSLAVTHRKYACRLNHFTMNRIYGSHRIGELTARPSERKSAREPSRPLGYNPEGSLPALTSTSWRCSHGRQSRSFSRIRAALP